MFWCYSKGGKSCKETSTTKTKNKGVSNAHFKRKTNRRNEIFLAVMVSKVTISKGYKGDIFRNYKSMVRVQELFKVNKSLLDGAIGSSIGFITERLLGSSLNSLQIHKE